MAVEEAGRQRSGTVTSEGGASIGIVVSAGLLITAEVKPAVVVDVETVAILERITGAGGDGLVVTAQAGDTVTWALGSPVAELRKGLKEVDVCMFKLLAESNLADGV